MKLEKMKRLIALYIDFVMIVIVTTVAVDIITMNQANLSVPFPLICIAVLLFLCIFFTLMIFKDLLFKNSSLGKKILGLGVFFKDGTIPNKKMIY